MGQSKAMFAVKGFPHATISTRKAGYTENAILLIPELAAGDEV